MQINDRRSGSDSAQKASPTTTATKASPTTKAESFDETLAAFGSDTLVPPLRKPSPQVQIGRNWKRPNKENVLRGFDEQKIVDAVLETFRFEAKLHGSDQPLYTQGEVLKRTAMLHGYLLEHRLDCGMSRAEALEVAQRRLLAALFGLPEPEVPVYQPGKPRTRAMRGVPETLEKAAATMTAKTAAATTAGKGGGRP